MTSENPTDQEHASTNSQAKADNHSDKSTPPIPPAVAIPNPPSPPHKHCEITCNIKRDSVDWWTLRLEGLGLFVLVVYTIFTGLMYCANRDSADAAKSAAETADKTLKQAISDRRPYVTLRTIGTVKISYGKPIQVNVQMINWGKSLANGVTLRGHVWFGTDIGKLVDQFLAQLPLEPQQADEQFLIPNIDGEKPESPSFIYTTITSGNQAPSHRAIQNILHQDAGVVVAGRCWYRDTFGTWYYTDFCYQTLLSGAFSTCPKHNEIH